MQCSIINAKQKRERERETPIYIYVYNSGSLLYESLSLCLCYIVINVCSEATCMCIYMCISGKKALARVPLIDGYNGWQCVRVCEYNTSSISVALPSLAGFPLAGSTRAKASLHRAI